METESAHTPGPWEVDCVTELGHPTVRVIARDSELSAVCRVGFVGADRVAEDATLIAAAPDLLEACKVALPLIPFTGDQTDEFGASRMLEEAIAKAEGRQP